MREGLILDYYLSGRAYEQHIEIVFEPSNLGVGEVWFFICPSTGKKCRKLLLWNSGFVHQSSIENLYYRQQTESSPERTSKKWIRKYKRYQELVKKQEQRHYKPVYAGRHTMLAVRATEALHRYALALTNEKEVWAWFYHKPENQG